MTTENNIKASKPFSETITEIILASLDGHVQYSSKLNTKTQLTPVETTVDLCGCPHEKNKMRKQLITIHCYIGC